MQHVSCRKDLLAACVLVLGVIASSARAEVEPYQEYGKRVKVVQTIEPLSFELFGDSVSLYTGSTEFTVTDIDVPGNSALAVRLQRRFKVELGRIGSNFGGFANWDVDVPYVDGVFSRQHGWTVGNDSTARCSQPGVPAPFSYGDRQFDEKDIWSGNRLHVPGQGEQQFLVHNQTKIPAVGDGYVYPWITKNFARIRCIPALKNGYAGEGFVALLPDGTRYYFDWMLEREASTVKKPYLTTATGTAYMMRRRLILAATRVEDRFGNWVNYTYTGDKLTRIESNDGRWIALTYAGNNITTVSSSVGTWTYSYGSAVYQQPGLTSSYLSAVIRPDGAKWSYSIEGRLSPTYVPEPGPNDELSCPEPEEAVGSFTFNAVHPSGAQGRFEFLYIRHYRTRVPWGCYKWVSLYRDDTYQELIVPNYFDNFGLAKRTISGLGMTPMTWTHDYGYVVPFGFCYEDGRCHDNLAGAPAECPGRSDAKCVLVTNPDGTEVRRYFGIQYGINEGREVESQIVVAGVIKQSTIHGYTEGNSASAFPVYAGKQLNAASFDPLAAKLQPMIERVLTQDGTAFRWKVATGCGASTGYCLDQFARPTQIIRERVPAP